MRSHLSLCVNDKLTSAGGLIDFCLSGPPKAWLLFCGVILSGTQTRCSGSFAWSTLGDCTRGSLGPAGVLLVYWVTPTGLSPSDHSSFCCIADGSRRGGRGTQWSEKSWRKEHEAGVFQIIMVTIFILTDCG